MGSESIVGLVKDLTSQLSAIAAEFDARAQGVDDDFAPRPTSHSNRDFAAELLRQRALRADHFPAELFHEPAWDMLLALFVAHEDRRTMNVKALVMCAQTPVTTSQRWLDHLHKLKLIDRVVDPVDRRRVEISLTDHGERIIRAYLDRLVGG